MKDDNQPAPEVLKPQGDSSATSESPDTTAADQPAKTVKSRRGTYRPSHKATFIGVAVVVAILAVNAALIGFVLTKQSKDTNSSLNTDTVTLSQATLDKLGVNRSTVGTGGIELVVGPNAKFNSKVQVGGDVSIAGQLKLNSKFSATDASLAKLDAGSTALGELNVNGNTNVSVLGVRNDLLVVGASKFQGAIVANQLVTVNNNMNVIGSLSVGGALTVNSFHTASLVIDSTLTIGGHIITTGSAPSISVGGGAVGSNGTVSISGNDASGTVAVNTGVGPTAGIVATITFRNKFSTTPHVVVTAVGPGATDVYVNRSSTGFSIGVGSAMTVGGHAFDYIVMQ